MEGSVFSLVSPVIVIFLVIFTRRIILSISAGILSSALILCHFNLMESAAMIGASAQAIFYTEGCWNTDNILLILFILGLGMLTAFIDKNGGTAGFARWAQKRVKSAAMAQIVAVVLGIIIFIDDYFNALTVGEVSRSLTDRYRVSREKLAYIIDSTSAPVCSICPLSSWGAYIIALFAILLPGTAAPLNHFIETIPYNFYAIFALAVVIISAGWNVNVGRMNNPVPVQAERREEESRGHKEEARDLVMPIGLLVAVSMGGILVTGRLAAGEWNVFAILENASMYLSLCAGCAVALGYSLFRYRRFHGTCAVSTAWSGMKKVMGATLALLFAWVLIDMISQLQTGAFLSGLLVKYNLSPQVLPVMLFIFSGIMAIATGFSWGVFGIMLPISVQMATALGLDTAMMYCCLGAVLSGSVFGDHCSPISDTTILSSTGAECLHINHVMSQLPYAFYSAAVASVGFLAVGFTENLFLAFALQILFLAVTGFMIISAQRRRSRVRVGRRVPV